MGSNTACGYAGERSEEPATKYAVALIHDTLNAPVLSRFSVDGALRFAMRSGFGGGRPCLDWITTQLRMRHVRLVRKLAELTGFFLLRHR